MDKIVELNGVSKTYDGKRLVLDNIDLIINAGETVVIKGKSGCGKSTLMNITGLIDMPSSGGYCFNGERVVWKKDYSRLLGKEIGFVFQSYHLIEQNTVLDNIMMPLLYCNKKYDNDMETYRDDLIFRLNLEHLKSKKAKFLSGGEKQRVAIARALITKPKLLLADEPTGNLDNENAQIINEQFKAISEAGTAVMIVTHSNLLFESADAFFNLENGKLVK